MIMKTPSKLRVPICRGCKLTPSELDEYVLRHAEEGGYFDSPDDVVRRDEGTYNRKTGFFWCTWCYLDRGQPPGTA
jgi:hypothetical protein